MFKNMNGTTKVIFGIIAFFLTVVGGCEGVKYFKGMDIELPNQTEKETIEVDTLSSTIDTTNYPKELTFLNAVSKPNPIKTVSNDDYFRAPKGYKLVPEHFVMCAPEDLETYGFKEVDEPFGDEIETSDSTLRVWSEHPYFNGDTSATHPAFEKKMNHYTDVLEDSIILFTYSATTEGTLEGIDIGYTLKIPKAVKETITVKETVTKEVYPDLTEFFIGGGLNATQSGAGFSVGASMLTKKHWLSSYNYDLVNKQHQVSFKYRIFKVK